MKLAFIRLFAIICAITLLTTPSVIAQTTCPTPIGLSTSSITANSAQLTWMLAGPVGASYFQVQYRPAGTLNWVQVIAQQQTYHLTSLNCALGYEWRVRSVCANTGSTTTSPYSTISNFTTLPCGTACRAPVGLTTTSVGVNNATVSWTSIAEIGRAHV